MTCGVGVSVSGWSYSLFWLLPLLPSAQLRPSVPVEPSSANAIETFARMMLAIKRKENRILKKGCLLIMLSPNPKYLGESMTPLCEKSYEYTDIFMSLYWISRLNESKILDFS
ncbi:MAG: hypothetical protein M0C28_29025 [Candidatus Moduliflexus flocculans]|nr:hypothetical protein [Candidatus Moduliflexus flocculans]